MKSIVCILFLSIMMIHHSKSKKKRKAAELKMLFVLV